MQGRALMAASVPLPLCSGRPGGPSRTADTTEHPRTPCRAITPQIIHVHAATSDDRRALTTVHNGGSGATTATCNRHAARAMLWTRSGEIAEYLRVSRTHMVLAKPGRTASYVSNGSRSGTPGRSVWILLGDQGRWPSGAFGSREAAVQWIAEHHLTGMITEYPVDVGVYDWAIAKGAFPRGRAGYYHPRHQIRKNI